MMEYNIAKTSESVAIQSSASMPRAFARTQTLMPEMTIAMTPRTVQTATMVRHFEAASSSGVACATQTIAAVRDGCPERMDLTWERLR